MRIIFLTVLMMFFSWTSTGAQETPGGDSPLAVNPAAEEKPPIMMMDLLMETGELSTFVNLLGLAGLDEFMRTKAPIVSQNDSRNGYTVFAPTNAAFARMRKSDLLRLQSKAHKDDLIAFLNHHIAQGKAPGAPYPQNLMMQDGQRVRILRTTNNVMSFGAANVNTESLKASNGVIYMIDAVQMPEKK